ncbi:MAG: hypothetical protein Q7S10_02985 [bacterium]|nr:hypothetical protein [bacterium]
MNQEKITLDLDQGEKVTLCLNPRSHFLVVTIRGIKEEERAKKVMEVFEATATLTGKMDFVRKDETGKTFMVQAQIPVTSNYYFEM